MKNFLILFLIPLFLFIGCSDDDGDVDVYDCEAKAQDALANGFNVYLEDYLAAIGAGDTTYEQPSDWKTKCDAYDDMMHEMFSEGCYDSDANITQESIDSFSTWCDI
ncbi:uncharacterized protein METZ01_LOCUS237777 [marine metagenome]|jgi:hypothetical protein|uniref:Uncharacterized protein n=1 Tax=marine metagenome TaxID=408172 RepID=A0A382HDT8_9ZZZZ|tara:strand:- start:170 stop:490 length:321 start_codon:yes stop_codon:yes gene_type:complete